MNDFGRLKIMSTAILIYGRGAGQVHTKSLANRTGIHNLSSSQHNIPKRGLRSAYRMVSFYCLAVLLSSQCPYCFIRSEQLLTADCSKL